MKKFLSLLCLLSLLPWTLSGCAPQESGGQDQDGGLSLVATTYPVYLFTTAVTQGAEGVTVELLVNQQTSCLHDYTLTVTDMKRIEGADVILMSGAGLEDFMSDALATSDAAVIDCSQGVDLLPAQGHEGHDHEEEYDPHYWMCPDGARAMLDNIARELSALDPDNASVYEDNLAQAADQLPADPLDGSALPCPYLITFHNGFQYFAQAGGLTILKSIEEEEGSEASAADIREIVELIETYHIPAIFTEVNGSDATAQAIARETGVAVYTLDMVMSGDGTGLQPYLDAMQSNYDTIIQALGGE